MSDEDEVLQRRRTAYHEAGHAVAAVIERDRFKYVSIKASDDGAGHLRLGRHPKGLAAVHRRGIVTMAGIATDKRSEFLDDSIHTEKGGDYLVVSDYAREIASPAIAEMLIELWRAQADELIEAHWPAVERVAEALLMQETVDFQECAFLVRPTLRAIHAAMARGSGGMSDDQIPAWAVAMETRIGSRFDRVGHAARQRQ